MLDAEAGGGAEGEVPLRMAAGEQATLAAGDSTLMFTVWGGNEVAMNLYTGAGYQVMEECRSIGLPVT
ncbi:hypothetical protein [Streptomyces sp. NPDC059278]|uniref:hypothetical protein n=1 Tax=Streptomyces sp. NPDC059278 TaxID=3346801 RepID=UPI00369C9DF6